MFGVKMIIKHNGVSVLLRPFCKEDLTVLVDRFSSMKIHLYTNGLFAQTLENEIEWYEKNRQDQDTCHWAIVPLFSNEKELPIGVTGLHGLLSRNSSCTSGIVIWDPSWWGKGIASASHLGRTLFAADYLNRMKINSTVREKNVASRRALEKVGYTVWGVEPGSDFREGIWSMTNHLIWFNPRMESIFFPEGTPQGYKSGIEKARVALITARKEVEFP